MNGLIRERALQLGFDACRFTAANPPDHAQEFNRWLAAGHHGQMEYLARNADKRTDPGKILAGAKTIIALAASYHSPDPDSPPQGRVARYAQFPDYHDIMGQRLKALTEYLQSLGGEGTRSLWYVDTGPLLERDLAQRAGLGFAGKHTNLISRELGNWLFVCEIITTLELKPDSAEQNRCGSCARCLAACPTGAIAAPFVLDARRCISYLTIENKGPIPVEFRRAVGNRIYGCDECLEVCPWNRFAQDGKMMRPHWKKELVSLDLLELLSLDEAAFRSRFAGTPILRAKRRGLLRNVCVALGNVGDQRVIPNLERAAADPEPLIAEHARWAIEEIQRRHKTDL